MTARIQADGSAPDRLVPEEILAGIRGNRFITAVKVVEETESTNDIASRLGRETSDHGVVIFAEHQSAGRGRLGRRWESSSGKGLWFSLLLRPAVPPGEWARLPTWSAVSISRAVDRIASVSSGIKWPNDLHLGNRKICGILSESCLSGNPDAFIVVGIGLNVNHEASDFPEDLRETAGSLRQFAGHPFDRQDVAIAILTELDRSYPEIISDFPALIEEAARRSILIGKTVEVSVGTSVIRGVAESLGEDGSLLVRDAGRRLQTLHAGEVTKVGWDFTPSGNFD